MRWLNCNLFYQILANCIIFYVATLHVILRSVNKSTYSCAKFIDILSAVAYNNIAQQQTNRSTAGKFDENQGHNSRVLQWYKNKLMCI